MGTEWQFDLGWACQEHLFIFPFAWAGLGGFALRGRVPLATRVGHRDLLGKGDPAPAHPAGWLGAVPPKSLVDCSSL